jgi:hypothetical protein
MCAELMAWISWESLSENITSWLKKRRGLSSTAEASSRVGLTVRSGTSFSLPRETHGLICKAHPTSGHIVHCAEYACIVQRSSPGPHPNEHELQMNRAHGVDLLGVPVREHNLPVEGTARSLQHS